MRPSSRLICLAIGILLLFILVISIHAQPNSIGTAINSTRDYVDTVNESAYFIFYPNLTTAYGYIDGAVNASRTNPAYASALLDAATSSAKRQLDNINVYKNESLLVLAVAVVALFAMLKRLMKPSKNKKDRRQKRKPNHGI